MKILLLSLVLGLVCAQPEPHSEQGLSQLSGEWKTLYIACSNRQKTSDKGPLKFYLRGVTFNDTDGTLITTFFVKAHGKCKELSSSGRKIADDVYYVNYAGTNTIHVIPVSENALISAVVNTDQLLQTSKLVTLLGKSNHVNAEDFEKFKEQTRLLGIPEENIQNISNTDNCPTRGEM